MHYLFILCDYHDVLYIGEASWCLTERKSWFGFLTGPFPVWTFYILHVSARAHSGNSGFLPQSKDMQARLTGYSKLPIGVNVSVNGCLYMSKVYTAARTMTAGIFSHPPAILHRMKSCR